MAPNIGYFLSSEEHGPKSLLEQAQLAETHGIESVWISDHFHPWLDEQGESPFVWGVIGAIAATTSLQVTTAVTCPTMRIHPAIVAQAAATAAQQLDGRFRLGVGTGENLNEHVLGDRWPSTDERLAMLEEAVEVMRKLWTGQQVSHDGAHYVVDRARLYTTPPESIAVPVSGFGEKATELAAHIGDGYVNTSPSDELVQLYRKEGGTGPLMGAVKVCWGDDERKAGELSQELPMPAHFDQASELVTVEGTMEKVACGPDPERHADAIRPYLEAGFDEVYVSQMGDVTEEFFRFLRDEVEPRL